MVPIRFRLLGSALLLAALSGCLANDQASGGGAAADPQAAAIAVARNTSHAVVAFVDTGINPYHVTYRDPSPEAYLHPSLYVPGYPSDALPLNLTLDLPEYWDGVRVDCDATWAKVVPGQLYWIPGTKIIGAVYLNGREGADCDRAFPIVHGILDRAGHGTMVSSRGASFDYGACRECKIVMMQTPLTIGTASGDDGEENVWLAENAHWIDAQSNSWGPLIPAFFPDTAPQQYVGGTPKLVKAVEKASSAHLAFWASGNGVFFRFGAVGHPTLLSFHLTPSAIIVGGMDSGRLNTWPGFPPHIVSDSCNSWAAYHTNATRSGPDVGGGTSGATPFAAGMATDLLLEARRILGDNHTGVRAGVVAEGTPHANVTDGPLADGVFTLAEWREILFKTASGRPKGQHEDGSLCNSPLDAPYYTTPVRWADVPAAYPEFLQIGYGAVDNESRALAHQVLAGAATLPDRGDTDRYFTLDARARAAMYQVWSSFPL